MGRRKSATARGTKEQRKASRGGAWAPERRRSASRLAWKQPDSSCPRLDAGRDQMVGLGTTWSFVSSKQ
jgi:hypothetical protein